MKRAFSGRAQSSRHPALRQRQQQRDGCGGEHKRLKPFRVHHLVSYLRPHRIQGSYGNLTHQLARRGAGIGVNFRDLL